MNGELDMQVNVERFRPQNTPLLETCYFRNDTDIEAVIDGTAPPFNVAGESPTHYLISGEVENPRHVNISAVTEYDGEPAIVKYLIRRPSKLGAALANLRGKEPQAGVHVEVFNPLPGEVERLVEIVDEQADWQRQASLL